MTRPVYTVGERDQLLLWQCPKSAIPEVVWELFGLWWDLRNMNMAPPVVTPLVRRAFSMFESQMRAVEQQRNSPQTAAAVAVAKLMKGGQ